MILDAEELRAVFDHVNQCWLSAVEDVCGIDLEDADARGRRDLLRAVRELVERRAELLSEISTATGSSKIEPALRAFVKA